MRLIILSKTKKMKIVNVKCIRIIGENGENDSEIIAIEESLGSNFASVWEP